MGGQQHGHTADGDASQTGHRRVGVARAKIRQRPGWRSASPVCTEEAASSTYLTVDTRAITWYYCLAGSRVAAMTYLARRALVMVPGLPSTPPLPCRAHTKASPHSSAIAPARQLRKCIHQLLHAVWRLPPPRCTGELPG